MDKLIAPFILVVIVGLCVWRYNYVLNDRDAEKLRADNATVDYVNAKSKLLTEQQNAANAESRAKNRLTEQEAIAYELREKNKCIDAGTCGVRVRWRQAICSGGSLHSAQSSPSGSDDIQVTERGDFERWVSSLAASVKRDAKVIEGLQAELEIKSDPGFCKSKN